MQERGPPPPLRRRPPGWLRAPYGARASLPFGATLRGSPAGAGKGWLRPPSIPRTPALRCGVRARPSCEPCPVAPDGAWPRRLRSRSMARAGAVHVRLRTIVGRRDLIGGVRAAAMTVRWSSGSAPATRLATAAPTACCPGSGEGSWGFKGGAASPWPDRNVSHCVGWLPRLSVPDTPRALATLGRQNLHTRTLRSPIRAVSTTGKTAMSEAFQRHPEGGSNSASGTSIRLLKSLNGTSCEDRTDGSYRRVASLRTACTWFSALRRNPMVCRVKRRMPARMDRLARSTMDVDMRAGSGSPIRWVLRMRGGSES